MRFGRRIIDAIQGSLPLRRYVYNPYLALRYALPTAYRREFVARITDALACPDLADIPRVPGAGDVSGGTQRMHNGLRVIAGGYYGYPLTRMMRFTGGVHEPQEEKAFAVVLPFMPAGAVMIELGAYWAFYSMWFNTAVRQARNYVVEPLPNNLAMGRENFRLNGLEASFRNEYAGEVTDPASRVISVDDFVAREQLDFVHMLHTDVQGFETDVLRGARRTLEQRQIGYALVSTHSEPLHHQCADILRGHGMIILAEATPAQSYSFDGLIVARAPDVPGPDQIAISHKP